METMTIGNARFQVRRIYVNGIENMGLVVTTGYFSGVKREYVLRTEIVDRTCCMTFYVGRKVD